MENTNTELKNVINTLNNERESLLEQVRQSLPRFLNILSINLLKVRRQIKDYHRVTLIVG